jgi:plastocyanin
VNKYLFPAVALLAFLFCAQNAVAEDYLITIKDHKFSPDNLSIPANEKVKLVVKNMDATPAEFESEQLKREKVVAPNKEITILLGPLKAGEYSYVDDFNPDSKGTITVK